MGDNHPYPNSPKAACTDYARDLGFEVLPPVRYALSPGDFTAQCETLKQSNANFAFLANTAESNVALRQGLRGGRASTPSSSPTSTAGTSTAAKQAGDAGNGLVWVVSVARWGDDVPGMKLVREVSKQSDPNGQAVPLGPLHPRRLLGLPDA